ncbi:MAG: hypothetical protein LBD29_08985 [Treponema sp.]|jgi:YbbR domain-containing protein|nr:hypothetical protein [Treponema sp.]
MDARKLLAKISENWPAKVLSIAVALILFMFHRVITLQERVFSVPLQLETEPNIVPASAYTQMIVVSVRGNAAHIRSLVEEDIEPYIDLTGKGRGTYRAPVRFRKKGTALSIEPLEIKVNPIEISLALDNKVSKYVPLKANIHGYVKDGYELINYTLNPSQVTLDGPSDLMTSITELATDEIELDGRTENFSIMIPILNQNPLVITIRGTTMTEFQGTVKPIMGLGNFSGLPIKPERLEERFRADLEIKTGMVRLGGNQQDIEMNTMPEHILLTVDCSGITQPGSYTLPVSVRIPSGFTLLRQEPEKVTLQINAQGQR